MTEDTQHKTLIGRTCGHCGKINCGGHPTVFLPTAQKLDKPILEETQFDPCPPSGWRDRPGLL